jgi:predicted neuraminidase
MRPTPLARYLVLPTGHGLFANCHASTWRRLACLETDEGEFSCPAAIARASGVDLTCTWNRTNLVVHRFAMA